MPWKPLPDPDGPPPRRLRDSLDRLTRSLGAGPADTVAVLFSDWEDLVGPQIAAHSRPRSLRHGVLAVVVDQPGWATQFRFMEQDLLVRLTEALGTGNVERIDVRVGDLPPD
jgi:predicted nucleic acid-binding Zn ribbon protein